MKSTCCGLLIMLGLAFNIQAQDDIRFTVEVSTDSILFGNYFQVTFTLENAKGNDFSAPDFAAFHVVSGPNQASSMSIINGEITQSVSYTYYLEPKDIGNFYILPASVDVGEEILETQPVEIMVVPNPEGIKQSPDQRRSFSTDGFDLWGNDLQMPDMQQLNEMFRQMMPNGNMDGFQFFQDSMPGFNLDEFLRMMPDMKLDIPEQLQEDDQPKDTKRKKKRKIYKI
ncbi:MAG: BatD family protein [Saprospiraceae bacterium]|nr:BatD family protein [Lewinella sp.]